MDSKGREKCTAQQVSVEQSNIVRLLGSIERSVNAWNVGEDHKERVGRRR